MHDYLVSEPFICVKSDTFFRFTQRRMLELRNVQMHLSVRPPLNFGTITSLLMHLIRYVCHSPIPKAGYLRDALVDVQFGPVCERFGMFFLHGLDLEGYIVDCIVEEDSPECLVAMSRDQRKPKKISLPAVENSEPTEQFPIGHAPTWKELAMAVQRDPRSMLRAWVWDPDWESNSDASRLFIHFTEQFWVTVHQQQLVSGRTTSRPKPKTLEEAMAVWTRPHLQQTLNSCDFIARNSGLEGRFTGKRHPGFVDLLVLFFPLEPDDINPKSAWYQFFQFGYLKEYYDIVGDLSEDGLQDFRQKLMEIFGALQCLPKVTAVSAKSAGKLWTRSRNGMEILTNPIFYKIEQIGKATRSLTQIDRSVRTKATKAAIQKSLSHMTGNIPDVNPLKEGKKQRMAVKARRERMGTARKNKRKPPVRKPKERYPTLSRPNTPKARAPTSPIPSSDTLRILQRPHTTSKGMATSHFGLRSSSLCLPSPESLAKLLAEGASKVGDSSSHHSESDSEHSVPVRTRRSRVHVVPDSSDNESDDQDIDMGDDFGNSLDDYEGFGSSDDDGEDIAETENEEEEEGEDGGEEEEGEGEEEEEQFDEPDNGDRMGEDGSLGVDDDDMAMEVDGDDIIMGS
jgi:hypothetical protein